MNSVCSALHLRMSSIDPIVHPPLPKIPHPLTNQSIKLSVGASLMNLSRRLTVIITRQTSIRIQVMTQWRHNHWASSQSVDTSTTTIASCWRASRTCFDCVRQVWLHQPQLITTISSIWGLPLVPSPSPHPPLPPSLSLCNYWCFRSKFLPHFPHNTGCCMCEPCEVLAVRYGTVHQIKGHL